MSSLPGLGLTVEGRVLVEIGWNFDLGFGISKSEGFFIDAPGNQDLVIEFKASIPGFNGRGELIFFQLDVEDLGSVVEGRFVVDINPNDPTGRLTYTDLKTRPAITFS